MTEPSPFHLTTMTLTLPLPPAHLKAPISHLLATHLTPQLLTFLPPPFPHSHLLLSYQNARLPTPTAILPRSGAAMAMTKLQVDVMTFKPEKGSVLEGWITLLGEGVVGVVVLGVLNGVITGSVLRREGWEWDGANWVGELGLLKVGKKIGFVVERWGGSGGVVILEGKVGNLVN